MKFVFPAALLCSLLLASCMAQHDLSESSTPLLRGDDQRPKRAARCDDWEARLASQLGEAHRDDLPKLARSLVRSREAANAASWLSSFLEKERERAPVAQLRAAVTLLLMLPEAKPAQMFSALIPARRLGVRRTAWQVASQYPSPAVAQKVEAELTRRGQAGLSPEAALAVRANRIEEAYRCR